MRGGSKKPSASSWLMMSESNGEIVGGLGGIVVPFTAAATLLIGDLVYLSAADNVNKTTTLATFAASAVGVVVGGKATGNKVLQEASFVGTTAALATELVLVAVAGIVYVQATAAIGAVGAKVTTDNASTPVAGQISVTNAAAGNIMGITLDVAGTGAGEAIRMLIVRM